MKPPAYALMKLNTTLSALVLSASAALAQTPDLPQPVPPATTPAAAPGVPTIEPPTTTTAGGTAVPVAPAPIEPPVQRPGTGFGSPGAVAAPARSTGQDERRGEPSSARCGQPAARRQDSARSDRRDRSSERPRDG